MYKSKSIVLDIKGSSRVTHMEFHPRQEVIGIVTGDMLVTYTSGSTYKYYNIAKPAFDRIVTAQSIGKALQAIVADKTIKYEKI